MVLFFVSCYKITIINKTQILNGVMVAFRFGTQCVPKKYSIVLTIARVELHWKLPVLCIVTFDKKQSLIFEIMSIFFRKFRQ